MFLANFRIPPTLLIDSQFAALHRTELLEMRPELFVLAVRLQLEAQICATDPIRTNHLKESRNKRAKRRRTKEKQCVVLQLASQCLSF